MNPKYNSDDVIQVKVLETGDTVNGIYVDYSMFQIRPNNPPYEHNGVSYVADLIVVSKDGLRAAVSLTKRDLLALTSICEYACNVADIGYENVRISPTDK